VPTLTQKKRSKDVFGSQRVALFSYTGPNPYVNGGTQGDPVVAADLGLGGIEVFPAFAIVDSAGNALYICIYDPTTASIRIWSEATGQEVANGVDLSAASGDIIVYG